MVSSVKAAGVAAVVLPADAVDDDDDGDDEFEDELPLVRTTGWRYPSNQALKHESYLCLRGVHSGERELRQVFRSDSQWGPFPASRHRMWTKTYSMSLEL